MVPCGLQLSGELKATSVNRSETVPLGKWRCRPVAGLVEHHPAAGEYGRAQVGDPATQAARAVVSHGGPGDPRRAPHLRAHATAEGDRAVPGQPGMVNGSWPAFWMPPPTALVAELPVSWEKLTAACAVGPTPSPPAVPEVLPVSRTFRSERLPSSRMRPPRAGAVFPPRPRRN